MQQRSGVRDASRWPEQALPLHCRIVIRGSNVGAGTTYELQEFLDARQQARTRGVTGVMHHESGYWIQYVEGTAAAVEAFIAGTRDGWRHRSAVQRVCATAPTRRFDTFSMPVLHHRLTPFSDYQSNRGRTATTFLSAPSRDIVGYLLLVARCCGCGSLGVAGEIGAGAATGTERHRPAESRQ